MHHHKWNIEHIDNLMPWEKEIYVDMLIQFLKEEEKRMREQNKQMAKLVAYKMVSPTVTKSVKGALKTSVHSNLDAINNLGKSVNSLSAVSYTHLTLPTS